MTEFHSDIKHDEELAFERFWKRILEFYSLGGMRNAYDKLQSYRAIFRFCVTMEKTEEKKRDLAERMLFEHWDGTNEMGDLPISNLSNSQREFDQVTLQLLKNELVTIYKEQGICSALELEPALALSLLYAPKGNNDIDASNNISIAIRTYIGERDEFMEKYNSDHGLY